MLPIVVFFEDYGKKKHEKQYKEFDFVVYLEKFNIIMRKIIEHSIEISTKVQELSSLAYDKQKSGDIEGAVLLYEEAVAMHYDIKIPYFDLINIYRKKKDVPNELRILKLALDMFPNDLNFTKRINLLENAKKKPIYPKERLLQNPSRSYEDETMDFLESLEIDDIIVGGDDYPLIYDDYLDDDEDVEHENCLPDLYIIPSKFDKVYALYKMQEEKYEEAKKKIAELDYMKAAELLEQLVADRCTLSEAYDCLRGIYQTARAREAELEIVNYTQDFFVKLKDRQFAFVEKLCDMFPKSHIAETYKECGRNANYYFSNTYIIYNSNEHENTFRKRMKYLKDYFGKKNDTRR